MVKSNQIKSAKSIVSYAGSTRRLFVCGQDAANYPNTPEVEHCHLDGPGSGPPMTSGDAGKSQIPGACSGDLVDSSKAAW